MDKVVKPKIEKLEKIKPIEKVGEFEFGEKKEDQEKIMPEKEEKLPEEVSHLVGAPTVGAPGIDTSDTPLHQNIESILEDGLEEIYFSLAEKDQERFKQKGEETANEIVKLVQTAKLTFKKVFKLILSWLRVIPGVNKFFIEQEAKIKTDRILEIEV